MTLDARGRNDVPDALLFPGADADAAAAGLDPWQRFRHGAALVEAKRWNRPLDRAAQGDQGVPAAQLMHYLSRADVITQGKMRWGILTNGRHWRLYWQGALSVADDYLEIDLGKVFGLPGCTPDLLDTDVTADHALRLSSAIESLSKRLSTLPSIKESLSPIPNFRPGSLRNTQRLRTEIGLQSRVSNRQSRTGHSCTRLTIQF